MLKVVILAGGLATRLRPLSEKIPKAMIEVCGKPFVHWQMELLSRQGVNEVVFCLGYKADAITNFIGDGSAYGIKVEYSFDGSKQLGTGGAIRHALPILGEHFMTLYGDSYLPIDFKSVEVAFRESAKPALMTVYLNNEKYGSSNAEFHNGIVSRYNKEEKDVGFKYIDYGLGCYKAEIFSNYENKNPLDLSQICSKLARNNQLAGFEIKERFYEIGSFSGIREFEKFLVRSKHEL